MSTTPHIPNEVFDKNHVVLDREGTIVPTPLPSNTTNDDNDNHNAVVHSVLLAEGIHHHIDPQALSKLPERFEGSSIKARITWFGALCLSGLGLFVEAYIIITTGQIKTVWHEQLPTCFVPDEDQNCPNNIQCCGLFPNTPTLDNTTTGQCAIGIDTDTSHHSNDCTKDGLYKDNLLCDQGILNSISYSEFAGIMLGMLLFGSLIDVIGRNTSGKITSLFMLVGITVLTFVSSNESNTLFLVWSLFFGIFGLGVGGEYPLSAAHASADNDAATKEALLDNDHDRRQFRILRDHEQTARRGETIGFVFAMQGVGAVCGSVFLLILLYFSEQTHSICDTDVRPGSNSAGYEAFALETVWRSFYFIGGIFVAMVLLHRYLIEGEGSGHDKMKARKDRRINKLTYGIIFRTYGTRLVATGGCWLFWDICFYGLKLFSGPIFQAIDPAGDIGVSNGYLLINNLIALSAYYICAKIIDYPSIGRVKVQATFFLLVSIVFLIMSQIFNSSSPGLLMALFFLSSFLGQFVNTTTYVMAAETYPAELRGTLHGLSAFLGKCGALTATIVFGTVDTPTIFLICGIVGIIGFALTVFFSVDMTHVSFAEHAAHLELVIEGRPEEYKGKLNHSSHLSLFERLTGFHGEYDPDWAEKLVKKERTMHGVPESHVDHE